jgi:hypothetical protein
MRPALDPAGHRVPRTKPTCLLHTWRPHRQRPFALVLHLHQHQSSHNMHLQYLAKNKSTQRCQSLITQGSGHPPVLEPHMVLKYVPNFHSITMCIKLPFQLVLIHSKWTLDERAMLVLLWHYNLSWRISECVALKDFTLTLCTNVKNWRFLMHWKEDLMELHNLQFSFMVPHWLWVKNLIVTATLRVRVGCSSSLRVLPQGLSICGSTRNYLGFSI